MEKIKICESSITEIKNSDDIMLIAIYRGHKQKRKFRIIETTFLLDFIHISRRQAAITKLRGFKVVV